MGGLSAFMAMADLYETNLRWSCSVKIDSIIRRTRTVYTT